MWCHRAGEDINVEERGRSSHFSGLIAIQDGTYSAIGSKKGQRESIESRLGRMILHVLLRLHVQLLFSVDKQRSTYVTTYEVVYQ